MKSEYYFRKLIFLYDLQWLMPMLCGFGAFASLTVLPVWCAPFIGTGIAVLLMAVCNHSYLQDYKVLKYWNAYYVEVGDKNWLHDPDTYAKIKEACNMLNPSDVVLLKNRPRLIIKGKGNVVLFRLCFEG